jgi:epoxyqueuosine reductase
MEKIPFRNFPLMVDEDLPSSVREDYEQRQHDHVSNQFEETTLLMNKFVDPTARKVEKRVEDPARLTRMVKEYARYLGAALVGVTRLNQETHLPYSGPEISYDYAIALAFEENYGKLMATPSPECMRDFWRTYSLAATGAVHVATFLRESGYEALAHHVRSHLKIGRAICMVPIAVDAGLGELGRNGVLITKDYGPRVRISIVTTSAPLLTDRPVSLGVDEFCRICRRCLTHCPTKAVSEEKVEVRGVRKWKVDGDRCINACARSYECTLCFKFCPWNKPNGWIHHVGSTIAAKSGLGRRLLNALEDTLYPK